MKINIEKISIILTRPKYPENIGAAARAMCSMGLKQLIVVAPLNFDKIKINKMATHFAEDIVDNIILYDELKLAIQNHTYIIGSTARIGKKRKSHNNPRQIAEKIISISQNNKVAIIFGPEDKGLSNEDLKYCHELFYIPNSGFSSINLSQAVMIMCYEILLVDYIKKNISLPRLATSFELEGMYDNLKDILLKINFINPDNPDYWMNNIRQFISRLNLTSKEVGIIRGTCRQIDWFGKKCFDDGKKS